MNSHDHPIPTPTGSAFGGHSADAPLSGEAALRLDLPPLPKGCAPWEASEDAYTADQMREYATAAILAERERGKPPNYWPTPVQELGLGVRALNCLLAERVYTVGNIYEIRGGILRLSNMGRTSAAEVSAALVARGWPPVLA